MDEDLFLAASAVVIAGTLAMSATRAPVPTRALVVGTPSLQAPAIREMHTIVVTGRRSEGAFPADRPSNGR